MGGSAAKQFRKIYREQVREVVESKANEIFKRKVQRMRRVAIIGWGCAFLLAVALAVVLLK